MEDHIFYEEIGAGRFSTVFKGRLKRTVEYVAIRKVESSHRSKIHTEVQALHSLDHANVLKFHAWFATTNHLWVVTEYCAGGDLRTLLSQDGRLPEVTVLSFGLDVLAALHYVHSRGILAVDLRPGTIYINEYGILKLADLGCACDLEQPHGANGVVSEAHPRLAQMARATPSYVAPELHGRHGRHGLGSDFWALGALVHEMAAGLPPYDRGGSPPDEVQQTTLPLPSTPTPTKGLLAPCSNVPTLAQPTDATTIACQMRERDPPRTHPTSPSVPARMFPPRTFPPVPPNETAARVPCRPHRPRPPSLW
jgi:serine/threonine-protein kinase ULK4